MIRLISLPDLDVCLLDPARCPSPLKAASIENGARLFGVDLDAFRSRLIRGRTPVGDPQGINQTDRQLNCVGCHIPIARTGQSPAETGAGHLSNRWVPLFSDLIIHDMGEIPQRPANPVPPPPFSFQPGTVEIQRNLADFTLPGQGLAFGREWRTPPLMGIGRIGPPFLHDVRVFLFNSTPTVPPNIPRAVPPAGVVLPARTVYTSREGRNQPLVVNDVVDALRAAIELHDLPVPDVIPAGSPLASIPRAGLCPVPPFSNASATDVCPPLNDANRSEARNVMVRWRLLTEAEQDDVINFLLGL